MRSAAVGTTLFDLCCVVLSMPAVVKEKEEPIMKNRASNISAKLVISYWLFLNFDFTDRVKRVVLEIFVKGAMKGIRSALRYYIDDIWRIETGRCSIANDRNLLSSSNGRLVVGGPG